MDMKALLEKMMKFAGEPEQKPGDQVRSTEKAKKGSKDHPFKGRLVGGESTEPTSNMLSELDKYAKETVVERSLAERWEEFKEEAFKDTNANRPARKGSRPSRDYGKDGEHSKRYTYNHEDTDESRGHKIIATKLKDIERSKKPVSDEEYAKHVERMKASQKEYLKKNPKSIYKDIDEAGASGTTSATSSAVNPATLSQSAKQAIAASTQLKAATGTAAPTNQFMKAIDAATQGTAIDAKSAQALEPVMNVVKMAASDPKLAAQFKGLASQARNLSQQQKAQQK